MHTWYQRCTVPVFSLQVPASFWVKHLTSPIIHSLLNEMTPHCMGSTKPWSMSLWKWSLSPQEYNTITPARARMREGSWVISSTFRELILYFSTSSSNAVLSNANYQKKAPGLFSSALKITLQLFIYFPASLLKPESTTRNVRTLRLPLKHNECTKYWIDSMKSTFCRLINIVYVYRELLSIRRDMLLLSLRV